MLKKTLYLTIVPFLLCFISTSLCNGALLVWDANSEYDLAGYRIYYTSGNYFTVVDLGNVTEVPLEDLNLSEYFNYIITLTAYDTSNNESAFSSVLQYLANDNISTTDNCPEIYNPSQRDTYPPGGNGIGDACECEGDFDRDGDVDGNDSRTLLEESGRNYWNNPCTNADPCHADFDCNRSIDAIDITVFFKDFGRNPYYNPCPAQTLVDWCNY